MLVIQQCPQCGSALPEDAPHGLCPSCLLKSGLGLGTHLSPLQSGNGAYHGAFIPPTPEELVRFFPHLEILELLGQGGMGAVYKARQIKLDRLVALKILPPALCKDPAFAERFTREARALARLCHPNIVAVHDFGEVEGLYFFVMEFVDGANLRHVLEAGRLTPVEALRIVPQICEALQYAHGEGVVHRDIKPENILLDQKGRVKVADFGLAKLAGGLTPGVFTLTGSRQVVGTPHYMAPEQMEKPHTVDHRADIYSLGVVLYEMLTGELPLGRFAPPSQKAPVDGRVDDVVLRALAKEPNDRFQHVSEIKSSLDGVGPVGSPARPAQPHPDSVCIPFYRLWGNSIMTSVNGLLRWDGKVLAIEMEIEDTTTGFFSSETKKTIREIQIALADLQSIRIDDGWFFTSLVLRGTRLGTLAEIPGSAKGEAWLYIDGKDRKEAERLIEDTCLLIGRRPVPPPAAVVPPPAAPRRGFLGRKVQSLVQKARYWMVDSMMLPASEKTDLHRAVPQPEAGPKRGLVRRVLSATVLNCVFWAILAALLGATTILMPWTMGYSRLFAENIYVDDLQGGLWPRTVYRTQEGTVLELPQNLTLAQVYRMVPKVRGYTAGFSHPEGILPAVTAGCLVLFLLATSSLQGRLAWRGFVMVGTGVAMFVPAAVFLTEDHRQQIERFLDVPSHYDVLQSTLRLSIQDVSHAVHGVAAHYDYFADAGPYIALGAAVALMLLGSWQLRDLFGVGVAGSPAAPR